MKDVKNDSTAPATGNVGKVTESRRLCFQCGNVGHERSACVEKSQTQSGLASFSAFVERRKSLNQLHHLSAGRKNSRGKLWHFFKLQKRIMDHLEDDDSSSPRGQVCDPVTFVASKHADKELAKIMNRAYREFFHGIMERIEHRFKKRMPPQPHAFKKENNEYGDENMLKDSPEDFCWQTTLNQAVRVGKPADFSHPDAIRAYSENKLIPRTQYLHYLIMDDNPFSAKLRALLLPVNNREIPDNLPDTVTEKNDSKSLVTVCSIGGGPGFDHLAICLVARFLYLVQNRCHSMARARPKTVKTQIFDLYDKEWTPIMMDLLCCFQLEASGDSGTVDGGLEHVNSWWVENLMTMHHGDIRNDLTKLLSESFTDGTMHSAICDADIIVCQFVLHENASFLLLCTDNEKKKYHNFDSIDNGASPSRIGGGVASVLQLAKKGALMVCTDSGNFLWPALKVTAAANGWDFMGDAEKDHKIFLGPKSFVILERVTHNVETE